MEIIEIPDHPYFVGLQAHPEFLSRPLKSSPCYLGLILASANSSSLDHYLKNQKIIFDDDSIDEPVETIRKLSLTATVKIEKE